MRHGDLKRTKIVCTLGPASETVETIRAMVAAGMNVARLNFSHGTYRHHAMLIRRIRQVEKETVQSIGILQDLQGPKIRVGEIPKNGILLRAGKTVTFVSGTGRYAAAHHLIPVPYPLAHFVGQNQRILFDDGKFAGRVLSVSGNRIAVQIDVGGRLLPHKGINIPDSKLTIPALTEKDKKDVAFGVRQGISIFALSFVSRAKDIHELRRLVSHIQKEMKIKKHPVQIIAKIERRAAFDHLEEIFTAVDGIMVARGDLGIEMPVAEVPVLQKDLIALARKYGKPVIVATQMLDSMQERPAPTRAEVSDIANAVIDHADAVMLSNESAVGRYPVRAVQTMYDVIREAEKSRYDDLLIQKESWFKSHPQKQLLQKVLHECGGKKKPEAIVIVAKTGAPVRELSRLRREVPLIAVLPDEHLARQAALLWGVTPVAAPRIFKKKHINLDSVLPLLAPVALDKSTVFLIEENSPKS